MTVKNNFYVLTGGPGSGKTTLIEQFRGMGYNCVSEAGRKIIKEQLALGGSALPWLDATSYSELMLQSSIQDYTRLSNEIDLFFFDRGIPDILGYVELINLSNKDVFVEAAESFRYNSTIFILPPWEDIYSTDAERKQNFELAVQTYDAMKDVYNRLGYELVEVPCLSVEARTRFILDKIKNQLKVEK